MSPGSNQLLIATISLCCTLVSAIIIIAYKAGQQDTRITHLEKWRGELIEGMRHEADRLDEKLDSLIEMIKA